MKLLPPFDTRWVADQNGCHIWIGPRHRQGYGRFGKEFSHRVAYRAAYGSIPPGKHVLHSCDNPPCVNPEHLHLGTHQENMRERDERGRRTPARGSDVGGAKLTEDKVKSIRHLYATGGYTQRELGAQNGVCRSTITCIIRRKTWRHVDE